MDLKIIKNPLKLVFFFLFGFLNLFKHSVFNFGPNVNRNFFYIYDELGVLIKINIF